MSKDDLVVNQLGYMVRRHQGSYRRAPVQGMSPWGYQGLGGLQESGSGLEWRIPYPLYGSFWELGLDENVNVSASILVAEDRCPVSLCLPLCKASSPPPPCQCQVPGSSLGEL